MTPQSFLTMTRVFPEPTLLVRADGKLVAANARASVVFRVVVLTGGVY